MAVMSGKTGKVKLAGSEVIEVTNWSRNDTSENKAYASSSTGGFKKRVAGPRDSSGSFSVKLDDTTKLETSIYAGLKIPTLELFLNGTLKYYGPAIIDNVQVDVDVDNGEIIGATCGFSGDGEWTNY